MPSENSNTQYLVTKGELDEVAKAIQRKAGISKKLRWPTEMASAINEIEGSASFNFSGVNVTSDKMIQNTTAWNNQGVKITGNIPERLESQIDDILISPSHMTRHTSSNWGNTFPQFSSGYYPESHQAEIQYDYSQAWEITPSTEDKTYYLLNTDDFNYANQPNRSNVTNFNSNAFPYAITVKSAPASGSTIDWTGDGAINISADKVLTNTYFYNTEGELTTGVIPTRQSISALSINLIDPGDLNEDGTFIGIRNFSAGYYAGSHTNAFKIASGTQSSIISINPSSTSQTITLFGGDATYDYFPKAITIASTSSDGSTNINMEIAKYLNNTISGSINNSYITRIRTQMFYGNRSITQMNCINCSYIETSAFQNCSQLQSASFPNCTTISDYGFYNCARMTDITFPKCETVGQHGFDGCAIVNAAFPSCITVGSFAFQINLDLETASFPKCDTIYSYAFYACPKLSSIYFPTCTLIGESAFQSCPQLTEVNFPMCTKVSASAFMSCWNLTQIDLPVCHTIGAYAFLNLSNLTSLNLPMGSMIGSRAFMGCSHLTNINISNCQIIGSMAFAGCSSITDLVLTNNPTIFSSAFSNCQNLSTVTLSAGKINGYGFARCFKLLSLILIGSTLTSLGASNAFLSTPIAGYTSSTNGTTGIIYVPQSLYSSYITANYWSYFSSRISSYTGDFPTF